ncbi:hypothetical protein DPX16_5954 [Anabarilius grahami]|uniref:Uncharacterized protein n=1 Tax=Anabarilius grahami TaxID=495550 RepID=A0A3N0Y423_ANAGA|nr:hypothetical protein DPX16_5954 [Anabarilius grahami]
MGRKVAVFKLPRLIKDLQIIQKTWFWVVWAPDSWQRVSGGSYRTSSSASQLPVALRFKRPHNTHTRDAHKGCFFRRRLGLTATPQRTPSPADLWAASSSPVHAAVAGRSITKHTCSRCV